MKLSALLKGIDYKNNEADEIDIDSVCNSFGNIKNGSLFVLVKKLGEDIAYFKPEKTQPSVIVCETDALIEGCDAVVIRVQNARAALSYIYSNYYGLDYDKLKIIGVTGTNGKTTTAALIKRILEAEGKKSGFIGTGVISIGDEIVSDENYSMTTPDPERLYAVLRAMCDLGCEYAVMEVSSHSLALSKVAPIKFFRGIFTNLSPEHLDFHKDEGSYFEAKKKLFSNCEYGIFNIDDKYGSILYDSVSCRRISCGIIKPAERSLFNIEMLGLDGSKYIYRGENFTTPISLRLPGTFNIYNSMLAVCCCVSLGIKPCKIRKAISGIEKINGRLNIIKNSVTVIIDYAHTSLAVEECLRFLSSSKPPKSKLTAVFGCGGERDRTKRPKMARSAQKYADKIIVTSDNTRKERLEDIINDIVEGFEDYDSYSIIKDRRDAIITAINDAEDGDTVVILGKGPEKYNITSCGYEEFDEESIVNETLKTRSERNNA